MVKKSKSIIVIGFFISSILAFVSVTSMLEAKGNVKTQELTKL